MYNGWTSWNDCCNNAERDLTATAVFLVTLCNAIRQRTLETVDITTKVTIGFYWIGLFLSLT